LTATLYYVRSEAIRRGGSMTLAKVEPPGCAQAGPDGNWGCGWVVFIDTNINGTLDTGEEVLKASSIPTGVGVQQLGDKASLTADRWGQFNASGVDGFVLHSLSDPAQTFSTALCMAASGRMATFPEALQCPSVL